MTLVRPRRARVNHDDGVRTLERGGRAGSRHGQVWFILCLYI